MRDTGRRRRLVPEVVQTSGMDCGPACLTALLAGFGIEVSYGRLREACQTDVDGTSIDALEDLACAVGLEAEQIMLPADHLLLPEAKALPAIVVVRLPNGFAHFVVAWSCHGGRLVQVMDPASGRRWPGVRRFVDELFEHRAVVPAADWREWAGGEEFLAPLSRRLERLGLDSAHRGRLVDDAARDASWASLAALDAAARMGEGLAAGGAIERGPAAAQLVEASFEESCGGGAETVPDGYWSVRPHGPAVPSAEVGELALRGAVVVRVRGRQPVAPERAAMPSELAAALAEKPPQPLRELWRLLRPEGIAPGALLLVLLLAAAGIVTEAILFRGLLDLGLELATPEQRLGLMAALLLFVAANRMLTFFTHRDALGIGRRLENRLRLGFLTKLPRLAERYFRSRPVSDMAERSHNLHHLRELTDLGRTFARYLFEVMLTAAGMIWIHPSQAPLIALAVVVGVGVPLAAQPALAQLDMRVRTHLGGLAKDYLDAMLGLVAVRSHGAERTLRREQESRLGEWVKSKVQWVRVLIVVEGLQIVAVIGCTVVVVLDYVAGGETGGLLLLAFWGLVLAFRTRELANATRDYATERNILLRLLEPLGTPEVEPDLSSAEADPEVPPAAPGGVAIDLAGVVVRAGGHTILDQVDLRVAAGEHLAIVGPSGAGKTSLVGLLLGLHRPAAGSLQVDGEPLDPERLGRLRRQTAWVDPAVQLWNRTLLENLRYGSPHDLEVAWGQLVEQAELRMLLERLPQGFQTPLGEGGGLVSGGEGQRVRLARAMARPATRLVILDEPFRGLGRDQRRSLLGRCRELWSGVTLLCITHDVAETLSFPRVAVIEDGRIAEQGVPGELEHRAGSRYAALLAAERRVRELWRTGTWRRLWLAEGRLQEGGGG